MSHVMMSVNLFLYKTRHDNIPLPPISVQYLFYNQTCIIFLINNEKGIYRLCSIFVPVRLST